VYRVLEAFSLNATLIFMFNNNNNNNKTYKMLQKKTENVQHKKFLSTKWQKTAAK